jgi:hypothetical protein
MAFWAMALVIEARRTAEAMNVFLKILIMKIPEVNEMNFEAGVQLLKVIDERPATALQTAKVNVV